MQVVIVGAGEVGFTLAGQLVKEGHDVTVIEREETRALKAEDELDVMVVRGNGARPQILDQAGVASPSAVDLLIACTNHDEVNILACWIAKREGVGMVVARTRSMEFTDSDSWAKDLGIDMMISPERSVAREIEELLSISSAVQTVGLIGGRAGVYAFRMVEGSPVAGMSLRGFRQNYPALTAIVVFVEKHSGSGVVPSGDTRLEPGDICYVVTFRDQVWRMEELFRKKVSKPLRRVIIAGGGKIGYQVAQRLERRTGAVDIRLIDLDRDKCHRLARELERTIVLNGDAADRELLQYEGVGGASGFVTTTAHDEANILLSALAKSLGAEKGIAVVRRKAFLQMHRHMDVDAIVSPNQALVSMILQRVRFPRATGQLSILESIDAEMFEATIPAGSPAAGRRISQIGLPRGIIMALVVRDGQVTVPWGDTVLEKGDRVILFAGTEVMPRAVQMLGVQ